MRYGEAAKQYFQSKGMPVSFPKRDSEDYKGIMSIMKASGAALAASGDATANSAVSAQVAVAGGEKKVRKARPKKEKEAPAAKGSDATPTKAGGSTTLIDQPHITKQSEAAVVDDVEAKPKKKRAPRAVQRDGETPQQNLLNANAVENGSMMIVPAAYPGLEGQIKKVLEVKPEGIPERKEVKMKPEILTSKTTEGKRSDDSKGLSGRAPFSFQAVRHLLRQ